MKLIEVDVIGPCLGVLLAEGHGAEAELAHLHAGTAELAITHHAPKRGARLGGNDDEIDGAVLLDLLLGTLGREEGGEEKPQHENGDGEQGNRSENFAEMKGHVSCQPFARRGQ